MQLAVQNENIEIRHAEKQNMSFGQMVLLNDMLSSQMTQENLTKLSVCFLIILTIC